MPVRGWRDGGDEGSNVAGVRARSVREFGLAESRELKGCRREWTLIADQRDGRREGLAGLASLRRNGTAWRSRAAWGVSGRWGR
jgi:hypothetical protein